MKKFTIEAPDGQVINEAKLKDGIIEFIPEVKQLPSEWELEKGKFYYYIDKGSDVEECWIDRGVNDSVNYNLLPTEELANAMLSFIKLITMRERYRGGWKPNDNDYSYIIYSYNKEKKTSCSSREGHNLSFQSAEIRNLFSTNFHDDIMICIKAGLI